MTGFQPNGKRKYKSFYARTQRAVLQKVRDCQTAIDSGLDVTKREPAFAEWAQTWYEGYRDQVSPTTYEGYGHTLKTLNKTFGTTPLRSIKAADVEAFLRELTADGKHQSQASKCRGMMFQIMCKAQANDLILKNPVELADKTRQNPQKSKKDSFTAEEVQKLFKCLPHDKTGDSIRLLLLDVVNALFAVLAILGIVVNPTTDGVGDSAQPLLTRSRGNNKRPSPYGEGGFCFWARILQKKVEMSNNSQRY